MKLIPQGHVLIRDNIKDKGNLFGAPAKTRVEWAKGLGLPHKGETIFFAGCGYQLMKHAEVMLGAIRGLDKRGVSMDRLVGLTKAFRKMGVDLTSLYGKVSSVGKEDPYTRALVSSVQVLQKLHLNIAYLYEEEPCCGSPLYYSGFEEEYVENAKKTYKQLKAAGVKNVIGLVPACTNSLRSLYSEYLENYDLEVKHFLEVVAEQMKQRNIRLNLKDKLVATYHDPCQLSRFLNITEEVREIIGRIEGLEFREVNLTNKQWSTCCGGGGGFEVTFPELSKVLAVKRVRELITTGASTILTSCPGCVIQLMEGVKDLKANIKVLDLAQVLDEASGWS